MDRVDDLINERFLYRAAADALMGKQTPKNTKPKSKLYDQFAPPELKRALEDFKLDRWIKVMHLSDIHEPFSHKPGLDVAYQLLEYIQPQICVVGSDFADFPGLSQFPKDPDITNESENVLSDFSIWWQEHMRQLKMRAPNTVYVFILGNHEQRLYKTIEEKAPAFRDVVRERFSSIISSSGAVWIGEKDAVRIGPLLVAHGNRVGENAAKNMLNDVGYQCSVMAGHTHQLQTYSRLGEDFPLVSVTGGCLTHYPHYFKRKRMHRPWMLGTAVASVDLAGRAVNINNLEFQVETGDVVWVQYEDRIFKSHERKLKRK